MRCGSLHFQCLWKHSWEQQPLDTTHTTHSSVHEVMKKIIKHADVIKNYFFLSATKALKEGEENLAANCGTFLATILWK